MSGRGPKRGDIRPVAVKIACRLLFRQWTKT